MAKDIAVDAKLCDALNALHCPNGDFLSAENVFAAAAEPSQSSYARMLSEFVRRGLHAKALALTCRGDSAGARGVLMLMLFYAANDHRRANGRWQQRRTEQRSTVNFDRRALCAKGAVHLRRGVYTGQR